MEKSNDEKSSDNGDSYKRQRQTPRCKSDEINYLLYRYVLLFCPDCLPHLSHLGRYLQECGFVHAAYTFGHESMLITGEPRPIWQRAADKTLPPGALVTFLQKGLQYVGIEESLRENKKPHEGEMSLLSQASIQALNRKNPPIQLTVPPAAAAAAVKARLAAEAQGGPDQIPPALLAQPTMMVSQASTHTTLQLQQQQKMIHQMSTNEAMPTVAEEPPALQKRSSSSSSKRSSKKQKLQKGEKEKALPKSERQRANPEARNKQDENDIVLQSADGALINGEHSSRNGKRDKGDRGEIGASERDKGLSKDKKNDSRSDRKKHDTAQANAKQFPTPDDVLLLDKHSSEVFMCAWNPVHTHLVATGSADASARIWELNGNLASDGLKTSIELPHGDNSADRANKDVTTLEWSSDGKLLATGSYDGIARVWDQTGTLIHTLRGHKGPIFSLKWNHSGTYLLSGSYDKTMIVWNANKAETDEDGYIVRRFADHIDPVLDVDWKDDNMFASCSADKTVHIYSVSTEQPVRVYKGHEDEVNSVKWSPSGKYLASCSDDCTAKVWEVDSNHESPLYDLVDHEQEIYTVKWSPTSTSAAIPLLATASFDGAIRLWNIDNGSCVGCFNQHSESVYSVAFSSSGNYLASGSLLGQLYVWDVATHKCVKEYKGSGDIFEVAWNKEETRVAACFSTNVVAIVDFEPKPEQDTMIVDEPVQENAAAEETPPPKEVSPEEAPAPEESAPKEVLPAPDEDPPAPNEDPPSQEESTRGEPPVDEPMNEDPPKMEDSPSQDELPTQSELPKQDDLPQPDGLTTEPGEESRQETAPPPEVDATELEKPSEDRGDPMIEG